MNEADKLSSELLSDRDVFVSICGWIREATVNLVINDKTFRKYKNNICVLPLKVEGITRRKTPYCIEKSKAFITYNPDDLTIVGGSALNLYDFKLESYKKKKEFEKLVYYTTKATSDIDIVWWPRVSIPADFKEELKGSSFPDATDIAIVSSSPAIIVFVKMFILYLHTILSKKLSQDTNITRKITSILGRKITVIIGSRDKPIIRNPSKIADITDILDIHIYMAGVYSIPIYLVEVETTPDKNGVYKLKEGGIEIKLADITIHDSASGQRSTTLEPMITDPVYSTTSKDIIKTTITDNTNIPYKIRVNTQILEFDIQRTSTIKDNIKIAVPNIKQFLWQQFFAIQKRIIYDPSKVLIHHKRISYMYNLLNAYNNTNSNIFSTLLSINSSKERDGIIKYIRNFIFMSKEWIYSCPSNVNNCFKNSRILEFCRSDEKSKMLVPKLCEKAIEQEQHLKKIEEGKARREFIESPEQVALRAQKRQTYRKGPIRGSIAQKRGSIAPVPKYDTTSYSQYKKLQPTASLHTNLAQPAYTQSSYTQPAYIQPAYIQPVYTQPAYTQTPYIQTPYTQPAYTQPAYTTSYVTPVYSYNTSQYSQPTYQQPSYPVHSYTQAQQKIPYQSYYVYPKNSRNTTMKLKN